MAELARPGFARHVLLLWQLRATIAVNQSRSRLTGAVAYLLSVAPAIVLGTTAYAVLRVPLVAQTPAWSLFLLNLLCFISASVFVSWPLLSAGVDDHSELSRYAAFPLSGGRLLFASSIAGLFEPRAIVIFSPLVGAALGYLRERPPVAWPLAPVLFVLYLLLCAGWGRGGVHFVLNVLRKKRSAELIGGFFVGLLVLCSLIPPVDTSWLRDLNTQGLGALRIEVIANAALALGRVPPGFFGAGLYFLGERQLEDALIRTVLLALFAALGYVVAYRQLLAFHRTADRRGGQASLEQRSNLFARTNNLAKTLFAREAIDLWLNPRARLLAAVPFLLAILLRLLAGRDLVVAIVGQTADAWLVGAFSLYGAVVLTSTFSQNAFGYDGQGLAAMLAAPIDPRAILVAKNRLHGLAGAILALAISAFIAAYFRTLRLVDWACAMAAVAAILPALLAAGNFISVLFPVHFHADLKRRDRLPFAASMFGVAAAGLGAFPFTLALRSARDRGVTWATFGELAACAGLLWLVYWSLLPLSLRLFVQRRELVLQAVTRD